ncbi:4Fe-4S dicluster domain-containing protein [Actinomyces radicidentis]|uniref:4Fe-4S dicluster domain-containing protein n=1 Tax=Actinomyces radicidentis TaxID=111015 RepID=UPI0026DF216E|nr:4Fe-4S dicluster domain-containing protein [Actinomyces radicidentis]
MSIFKNQLSGPTDPLHDANYGVETKRKGFFTDTSICIGCKACEVACKEWNRVPARQEHEHGNTFSGNSFDNSYHLGANQWRHVAFVEQTGEQIAAARRSGVVALGMPSVRKPGEGLAGGTDGAAAPTTTALADPADPTAPGSGLAEGDPQGLPAVRWLMSSDVCKHCTHAACLDVCPTGALFRSEFGSVVVQPDVCNGCGYCVAACPFGVIDRREKGTITIGDVSTPIPNGGVAQKCTLCYDRLKDGQKPACAKNCPTESIHFGDHDEMVRMARERLAELHAQGHTEARLYGANPDDGVGGTGSVFLLMDEPEAYGLPPDPEVTTADIASMFTHAGVAGTAMIATALGMFVLNGRQK